jgi:hypothetical protein
MLWWRIACSSGTLKPLGSYFPDWVWHILSLKKGFAIMLPDLGVKLEALGGEITILDFTTEQEQRLRDLIAEIDAICAQQKRKLAS